MFNVVHFMVIFMSCELSEIRLQETYVSGFMSVSQFAGFFSPSKQIHKV
jgi:hypothetical protein